MKKIFKVTVFTMTCLLLIGILAVAVAGTCHGINLIFGLEISFIHNLVMISEFELACFLFLVLDLLTDAKKRTKCGLFDEEMDFWGVAEKSKNMLWETLAKYGPLLALIYVILHKAMS